MNNNKMPIPVLHHPVIRGQLVYRVVDPEEKYYKQRNCSVSLRTTTNGWLRYLSEWLFYYRYRDAKEIAEYADVCLTSPCL